MVNMKDPTDKPPLAIVLGSMVIRFHMGRTASQIQAAVGPFRNKTTGQEEFFSIAFIEKITGSTRLQNEAQAEEENLRRLNVFANIIGGTQDDFSAAQIQDHLQEMGSWAERDLIEDIISYYSKWVDSSFPSRNPTF